VQTYGIFENKREKRKKHSKQKTNDESCLFIIILINTTVCTTHTDVKCLPHLQRVLSVSDLHSVCIRDKKNRDV
jgi:hypothetical protein